MGNRTCLHNQSGMALVMTLLIISFLVAMTLQLMMSADRQMSVAANAQERVRLDGMVLGGLQLVLAALQADQKENNFDSALDRWATFDPDKLKDLAGDIQLEIQVDDLGGRLSINGLLDDTDGRYRAIWLRMLTSGRFAIDSQEQAESLLDALIDWLDEDDDEHPLGAESGYYQGLETPYSCRNGTLLSDQELLLVRGMTPQIVYGTSPIWGCLTTWMLRGKQEKLILIPPPTPCSLPCILI